MIIDGKKVADEIMQEIKAEILHLSSRKPCLAVVLVGENPPSQIYVNRKAQACETVGILSQKILLPADIPEAELLDHIYRLNEDSKVDGILVQLPLPHHIHPFKITQAIHPGKDVDGFHPLNVGKAFIGETDGFLPCTPLGIKVLLERYKIEVAGLHALVIGRSNIVGKPMASILMQSTPGGNATVTIAHRHTRNLKQLSLLADIIIVAVGQPNYVTADMVKEGAVVIDVGINRITHPSKTNGYQIVGDVDYEHVKEKCSYITPVPGGVGPMTIAMLLQNTWHSYKKRMHL